MFTLAKLAYYSCSQEHRHLHDSLSTNAVEIDECCNYLLTINHRGNEYLCQVAAENGHLDCLMRARQFGTPWNVMTCLAAVNRGSLECLEYAHRNGCPWNEQAVAIAATEGRLDCLRYLHENGCPWHNWTCAIAAGNGQVECLRYARENGCPYDADICMLFAIVTDHSNCLQYIQETIPPIGDRVNTRKRSDPPQHSKSPDRDLPHKRNRHS